MCWGLIGKTGRIRYAFCSQYLWRKNILSQWFPSRCMYSLDLSHRTMRVGAFTVALVLFVACDVPTSGPSFETDTGLNSPVVINKTFTLLGGDTSPHDPLIDTTTAQFDSLFTVGTSDQSIFIEEEVSSFDIGSLDQALDEAAEGVGADTSLSEPVIQGSPLATQDVSAGFRQENGVPPPTPSATETVQLVQTTIPFPPGLLVIPEFDVASIDAERVKSGTLTGEKNFNGAPVNRFTFTLFNDPSTPTTLTDGTGNPPRIKIRDEEGDIVANEPFGATITAGNSESVEVGVEGETLGENSELVLVIDGHDQKDELTVELFPLRYQEATLGGVDQVGVTVSKTGLSARGTGGSQFAGIEMRGGSLQLSVANNLSFPVEIDTLLLENHLQGSALPDSFKTLDVLRHSGPISSGATETFEIDLGDKGFASSIDATLKGGLAQSSNTVTISADGNVELSASGSLPVEAMYFWPNGEQVQTQAQFEIQQDRISFDQPGDFVELSRGTLALDNFVSELTVGFESFKVRFADLRSPPYDPGDPLTVEFSIGANENPDIDDIDLGDLRLSPTDNAMRIHLKGDLETIPPADRASSNLRVIRFSDEVRTDVSVGNLDVRALEAGVNPFMVDITNDANGDGRLDLSDPDEASQAAFEGLDGIAESVSGLELAGSELNVRVTTDVGTNAQLVAALQGRSGSSNTFLAGKGSGKSVPSTSAMGEDFYEGASRVASGDLIQIGVDGAPTDDPVTRSIALTDENSTVDDFLSTLPTSLRFVAQARITGNDDGRIRLRRPLAFDLGLGVTIPVRLNSSFVVQDTIDADFSALEDVTDPTDDVTVSTAELRVRYTNGVPLGADVRFIALDDSGAEVVSLPGDGSTVRLKPALKAKDGTASGPSSGTAVLKLSTTELQNLARGRQLRLVLAMDQAEGGGPATLRATDTIELSLEATVEASVSVNN